MSIAVHQPLRMSLGEFLDWPGDGRAKHYQLIDGEVRPMPVTDVAHGMVQANVAFAIWDAVPAAGATYRGAINAAIVPSLRSDANLRVADIAYFTGVAAAGQIAVTEPVLLVEILSQVNEAETREAVRAYTTIPSVQEILVVRSTRIAAEVLRRGADGGWPNAPEEVGPGGTIRLDSIGLACAIGDFYDGTHLVT